MQGETVRNAAGIGTTWLLAALLLVAACSKVRDPDPIRRSLARLTPGQRLSDRSAAVAADGLAAFEGVLGLTALMLPLQPVPGVALALLYSAFLVAILRAHRLGVECGCFGSLSTRTTGAVELARGWCLAVLGWAALGVHIGTPRTLTAAALLLAPAAAATGLVVTVAAMLAASPAGRRSVEQLRSRPRVAEWRRAGPMGRRRALQSLRDDRTFLELAGDPRGWWFEVQRISGPGRLVRVVAHKGRACLVLALDARGDVLVVSGRASDGSLVSRLPSNPARGGSGVDE